MLVPTLLNVSEYLKGATPGMRISVKDPEQGGPGQGLSQIVITHFRGRLVCRTPRTCVSLCKLDRRRRASEICSRCMVALCLLHGSVSLHRQLPGPPASVSCLEISSNLRKPPAVFLAITAFFTFAVFSLATGLTSLALFFF